MVGVKKVRRKEKVPRRPTGYKFFLRECIQELREKCPEGSIVLPILSQLCAQKWTTLNPRLKVRFQQEADYFAHHGIKRNEEATNDAAAAVDPKKEPVAGTGPSSLSFEFKVPDVAPLPPVKKIESPPPPISLPPAPSPPPPAPPVALKKPLKRLKMSLVGKGGPKRPLSSFVYFCKEERSKVMKLHPSLKMGQVSQVLSKLWGELDVEQKGKYQRISRVDRERYSVELAAFKKSTGAPAKKIPKRRLDLDPLGGGGGVEEDGSLFPEAVKVEPQEEEDRFMIDNLVHSSSKNAPATTTSIKLEVDDHEEDLAEDQIDYGVPSPGPFFNIDPPDPDINDFERWNMLFCQQ